MIYLVLIGLLGAFLLLLLHSAKQKGRLTALMDQSQAEADARHEKRTIKSNLERNRDYFNRVLRDSIRR